MANIFALRNSSLNAFLFSDVGVEANGTSLTILSLLARLGKDPWAEAAAWARKPKDAAIRVLTDSISQMPPNQQAFDDAFLTASRLVDLLPAGDKSDDATNAPPSRSITMSKKSLLVFVYVSVFVAFTLWQTLGPKPGTSGTLAVDPVTTSTK